MGTIQLREQAKSVASNFAVGAMIQHCTGNVAGCQMEILVHDINVTWNDYLVIIDFNH